MRARLLVQDDHGRAPGDLAQHLGDRPRVVGVGRDDQAAGVAVPARPQASSACRWRCAGSAAGRPAARSRSRCGSGGRARARRPRRRTTTRSPRRPTATGASRRRGRTPPAGRRRRGSRPRREYLKSGIAPRRRRRSARRGWRRRRCETACRTGAASARRRENAVTKPWPQARSSPRWWASSTITSVRSVHCRPYVAATDATRA